MLHLEPELRLQALRDERAVAGLRVGLDAHEHSCPIDRHRLDDRPKRDPAENLPEVPRPVLRSELNARALADPAPVVLPVLELSKLGGRCQLLAMSILDSSLCQRLPGGASSWPRHIDCLERRDAGEYRAPD